MYYLYLNENRLKQALQHEGMGANVFFSTNFDPSTLFFETGYFPHPFPPPPDVDPNSVQKSP